MYYVVMKDRDIRDNLATEQYLMNNVEFDAPLVLFTLKNHVSSLVVIKIRSKRSTVTISRTTTLL
jgi:hypothetical protein